MKKHLFIVLLLILIFPFNCLALNITGVSLQGNDSVKEGETYTLRVKTDISGFDRNSYNTDGIYMVALELEIDDSIFTITGVHASGYESEIGKNGIALSKGQKQRLILARAFSKQKPIMIFDDSFSAIDRINKKKILENLLSLKEEKSSKIFVTHDIELAPQFDKVIYLNDKHAICGTHLELMKNNNYRAIYSLNQNKIGEEYV